MPLPRRSRPFLRWILAIVLISGISIQFIRPTLQNPPVTAEIQVPPGVRQILHQRCYTCHSNQVQLPLLDQVVPAYWIATHDIQEARAHLNFSEIGKLPAARQRAMLFEAVNQIQMGAMPLPAHLRIHPDSGVTPAELAVLRQSLLSASAASQLAKPAEASAVQAADAQYSSWIASGNRLS